MKNLFLSLVLTAISFATFANAGEKSEKKAASKTAVTFKAQQTLAEMYGDVQDVQWKSCAAKGLMRADFSIDGEKFAVFFDKQSNYVATTNEKQLDQLPALLRKSIKTGLQGQQVKTIIHYTSLTDDAYFVEVASEAGEKVFRVEANGRMTSFRG